MRKLLISALAAATCVLASAQSSKLDTIYISTLYTTHIVFSTDLTYGDISNTTDITARIVEQNKNMMAVKARQPFTTTASISALESNGNIHTFIIAYDEHPKELIIDTRNRGGASGSTAPTASSGSSARRTTSVGTAAPPTGESVSNLRMSDAPMLEDVVKYPRQLYHLTTKSLKVEAAVENIFAYSYITYVTLSLTNNSGVSYEASDAMFVVESRNRKERKMVMESNLYPRNRYGTLTAAPGEKSICAYTLDKITLSRDQVIKVYIYENGGQRNYVLTLSPKDINLARRPR